MLSIHLRPRETHIADIKDLTHVTSDLGVGARELNLDRSPAEIGSLREVGNGGDQGQSGKQVVKESLGSRFQKGQSHKGEG